jgi:cysteine desulfurase family protein
MYFDNAATTWPKPQRVEKAVANAMRCYGANPGRSSHKMAMETAQQVFNSREAAAALFGAEVDQVVFTSNCTHALNMAIKGVLQPGDHVIISQMEHNSVLRPVHTLAQNGMITYSILPIRRDAKDTLACLETLVRPCTKLIACTHGSNVWGLTAPIKEIGELAEKRDIFFMVDAAQTAGVIDINVKEAHIDFLCTAGHKSLYGPPGTGLLITPHGEAMATLMEGGTGSVSSMFVQPAAMPERMESGTANTSGIIGLGAGIAFVTESGIANIYAHEMAIAKEIYTCLNNCDNILLYTDGFEEGRNLPLVSFNIEGLHSEETVEALAAKGYALRGGLHCAPLAHEMMGTTDIGAARISVGAFNTRAQARCLCREICRMAKSAAA